MSTTCDSCEQILDEDDGIATVVIRDPTPDFSSNVPQPAFRRPPRIDLCANCLMKMIAALGLPDSTFTPRQKPAEPMPPAESAGALTDAELLALGLKDP